MSSPCWQTRRQLCCKFCLFPALFVSRVTHCLINGDRYLKERRGVSPHNILVHGHSMGGAVAVQLASLHAEERLKCVADRTFARLGLVIGGMLTGTHRICVGLTPTPFSPQRCHDCRYAGPDFWHHIFAGVCLDPYRDASHLPPSDTTASVAVRPICCTMLGVLCCRNVAVSCRYFIRGIWIIGVGIQSLVLLSRRLIPRSIQQNGGMCSRLAASLCVFLFPCLLVFGLHYVPWAGYVLVPERGKIHVARISVLSQH